MPSGGGGIVDAHIRGYRAYHNQLYLPPVSRAKQLLDQGILGTV
jgi:hypothetical protein